MGSKQYVVIDQYADNSGIVAVFGPFATEQDAKAWPGMPSGPEGGYSVHQLFEAPCWVVQDNG